MDRSRRRARRRLRGEELEPRHCLADVAFAAHDIACCFVFNAASVYASDVDGDGDVDMLSAGGNTIAWYENTDGKGKFGNQRVITTARGADSVYASDVDGDGDVDVLSAGGNTIAWYENTDGKGKFGAQRVISTEPGGPVSVYATDLDGDGDVDALSATVRDNKMAWYENMDGKGTFGTQRVITRAAGGPVSVYATDVDGDGDVDVLSAAEFDGKIAWYANTDGKGTFGGQRVITTAASRARSVYPADVDGDGDVDVLSASYVDSRIAWYENLSPRAGDANGDGLFNSADLVLVFQAGKYEDGIPGNATFAEGDWNGDGDFDSSDLVLAFQKGRYVAEARPLSSSRIAAAVDHLFALDEDLRQRRVSRD